MLGKASEIRVNFVDSDSIDTLEKQIHQFLECNEELMVVDIRHQMMYCKDESMLYHTALIIYKEGEPS
jgi:hypothetical protein